MNKHYEQVRQFHAAFGAPAADVPAMASKGEGDAAALAGRATEELAGQMKAASLQGQGGRALARASWMTEEIGEFLAADTVEDQADALIDLIYFALGTFVEMGLAPEKLFEIVHAANMAKLGPEGKPIYNEQGKVSKPEGWQAPEPLLIAEINRQRAAAEEAVK
jgi:predicted HAD superfamily Cof-like phosphohydrolase